MAGTMCSRQKSREDKHESDLKQPQNTPSFPTCGSDKTGCNSASASSNDDENSSYRDKNTQSVNGGLNSTGIRDDMKKTKIQNEYSKQANFFNMQSAMAAQDAFFKGYDMPAYYGWLPGIAPLRFPAFFYPPSFFGFTPNMGYAENNANRMPQCEESEKHDQFNSTKHDTQTNSKVRDSSEFVQEDDDDFGMELQSNAPLNFDESQNSNSVQKDAVSDVDEGLVLEDNDANSLKRGRVLEHDKCQPERRVATVSVIQENSAFHKSAEKTSATNEFNGKEEENKEPAKRGRASTRQIEKTEQYWDRRKKNNVSAKKSRDARRQREIMTNQRSALLESENLRLRAELATLREENERLRKELSNVTSSNSS